MWRSATLSTGEQALVMEQKVGTLLREETIEVVPALNKESRFYSRTSLFRGKGCVRLRSKLTEPLSHTTEVQKALFEHVLSPDPRTGGHERSKDAYSFPITGSS